MKLSKLLLITLLGLLVLHSCNEEDIKVTFPSSEGGTVEEVKGDLYYINGNTNYGEGINSSGNAQQFLDCTVSAASFFPDFLKGTLVAFGAVTFPDPGANCGHCSIRYGCSPGDNVLLEYWGLGSFLVTTFDDFESNINNASTGSDSFTCPTS